MQFKDRQLGMNCLKKLLESRISNPEVLKALTEKYSKKKNQ